MHDYQIEKGEGGVNYKKVTYYLIAAVVSLIIYLFGTTVAAQTAKSLEQDTRINKVEDLTQQLVKANLLLTQIVCQQKGVNCASLKQ